MGKGAGPDALPGAEDPVEPGLGRTTALHLLCNLGWNFLPAEDSLALQGGTHAALLVPRLADVLRTRRFHYKGQPFPLSPSGIEQIVRQLSAPSLAEGLLPANEQLYNQLAHGVTVTEPMPDGKRHQPTIALIDWHDPAANRWDVTERPPLLSTQGTHSCVPDLVCFVNGIPLAVIEAGATVDEGIGRHLHHQRQDQVPQLFAYAQLLLAVSPAQGRYGTTGTPAGWWARWREEEITDAQVTEWKNQPLDAQTHVALGAGKPAAWRQSVERRRRQAQQPTEPDRLLAALLRPARLLEFLRVFVLFDRKVGKVVARHPQFFATRALVARIHERRPGGGREGGIVWHASGSGRSFTMAFLAKALVLHHRLVACRVVVVTDRIDLEDRLARNCRGSGAFGPAVATHPGDEKVRAGTGRELARRIGQGTERIVFTPARRFGPALRLPECHNPSTELVVLVDEGGWRVGNAGQALERLRRALPCAACVAFTGTPLLQEEKAASPFGPVVHAYPMQGAVEDGVVLPLLCEERVPSRGAAGRIEWIARDIAVHFSRHVKPLGWGLKGVVAMASKLDALRCKHLLDETGLVSSGLLISAPGRREGQPDRDEGTLPELRAWWDANVGRQPDAYETRVRGGFGSEGGPDLLIVVDRLFTAVAEPRAMVLYIDQPLRGHPLIRAMACVNRLHGAKRHGVLLDYRGVLRELVPMPRGGYEPADIEGLVQPWHGVDEAPDAQQVVQQVREPAGVYQVHAHASGPPAREGEAQGQGRAHTYAGILRRVAGEPGFLAPPAGPWAEEACEVDRVVQAALLEHSLSPRDIEAAIRKALLPRLFGLMGLERAKAAIDQVIQAAARVSPASQVDDRVTGRR